MERRRLIINGLIQGVGFRPFLYNLATEHGLTGWVRNNFAGVELEVQGELLVLEAFINQIQVQAPMAAVIENLTSSVIPVQPETGFAILTSEFGQIQGSPLPDQGICSACASECFDQQNRRYLHPFNSCTICGPRFTIIDSLPFDRHHTSMSQFGLCPDCTAEYQNPANRRFHAQTIACPNCGPQLSFTDPYGKCWTDNPAEKAREILGAGGIIAIKGIGGYHLACDAYNESVVSRLRKLKGRDHRPFAVMFKNIETLREHCYLTAAEETIINSASRPILLLVQKSQANLGASVNPGLNEIGGFLPYTAIQFLLFDDHLHALVMTSGNRSGEPLTITEQEATTDLEPMVEGFLSHNRPILWRCDDSVLRWQQGHLIGIRRSRGYAPAPVDTKKKLVPLLACGAQQKNVFGLTKETKVYLSPHQGDLDNYRTFLVYQETIEKFKRLLRCNPEWAVHDLHPDYNSTIFAHKSGLRTIGVQHHLAHLNTVIASQKIKGPVIGVVFDGSGYGTDHAVWGGEFFSGSETSWNRSGHLIYHPLPGGEAAVKEPWRMAASYLHSSAPGQLEQWLAAQELTKQWYIINAALKAGINSPPTSSVGRLFDGIAALAGGPLTVSYEGEAAVWLENQADQTATGRYQFQIETERGGYQIDPGAIAVQVVDDLKQENPGTISMKFHRTMATLIGEIAKLIRAETNYQQIVLCGGVFQNRLLLDLTLNILDTQGFQIFLPEIVPINDAGIALGQAWLGNLMIERGIPDVFSSTR